MKKITLELDDKVWENLFMVIYEKRCYCLDVASAADIADIKEVYSKKVEEFGNILEQLEEGGV